MRSAGRKLRSVRGGRSAARFAATLAVHAAFALLPAQAAEPPPGRHEARLCVSQSEQPPSCGTVVAEVRGAGSLLLRYSDIVYELQLHSSQIEVLLRQGPTHLDGFVANYEWRGEELRFFDAEKKVRYAVQFGTRAR